MPAAMGRQAMAALLVLAIALLGALLIIRRLKERQERRQQEADREAAPLRGAGAGRGGHLRRRRPGRGAGPDEDPEADEDGNLLDRAQIRREQAREARRLRAEALRQQQEERERRAAQREAEYQARQEAFEEKEAEAEELRNQLLREEEERREAEFDEWRGSFEVEEAGEEAPEADGGVQDAEERRVGRILEFLRRRRVVSLTEAGARFGLKPAVLAERLRELQEAGRASGVLDADRGKFVWIEPEEFDRIRDEVKRRGRVTAGQLQALCNRLVDLTPSGDPEDDLEQFSDDPGDDEDDDDDEVDEDDTP